MHNKDNTLAFANPAFFLTPFRQVMKKELTIPEQVANKLSASNKSLKVEQERVALQERKEAIFYNYKLQITSINSKESDNK